MATKRKSVVVKRSLVNDISRMIEEARSAVALTVNAGLTILYWQIGLRIRKDILAHQRAEYGKQILVTLSQELMPQFGRGFSDKSLRHMVRFAEAFPDSRIVSALLRQLSTKSIPFNANLITVESRDPMTALLHEGSL